MKVSKVQRSSKPKRASHDGKAPRPRGRPRRAFLHDEDADAVYSLQIKMMQLENNIKRLNQMIQEEVATRQMLGRLVGVDRRDSLSITPLGSPTLTVSDTPSIKNEQEEKQCFIADTDLLRSTGTPVAPVQDALIERFVDSYNSVDVETAWIHDGRPWLLWRCGAEECAFSPLLQSAYLAVSTAYTGLSLGDKRLIHEGERCYQSVLRALQKALADPELGKSDTVLMTAGLCMNYEGRLSPNAKAGYSVHVSGVLKLFAYRGPGLHRSGLAHYFFADARLYTTWGAILSRQPTFLSSPEWKTIPWSLQTTGKDLTHHLFDQMLEIPKMLWYYDQSEQSSDTAKRVESYNVAMRLAKEIRESLGLWKCTWLDRAMWRRLYEKDLNQSNPTLPVFRYRDPSNAHRYITPAALVYPNGALFAAACNYHAALLVVLDTMRRLDGRGREQEQTLVAWEICRSMSYFLMYLPRSMLGRVSFAVVAAYDSLPHGGVEREYLEEVYHHSVGGTWRRFEDFLQEFSVSRKH